MLARGHGHGSVRREAAAARARRTGRASRASSTATTSTFPTSCSACTGTRSSRDGRATPRRSTTAACARRGSSTCAPTGWATTRGCGSSTASSASSTTSATRNGCGAASRARILAAGDRPAVELELEATNQRGEITTPGHATILLPSREHGPVRLPDPPGGATDLQGALDRDLRGVQPPMSVATHLQRRRRADAAARPHPDKRNAIDDEMMLALIAAFEGAAPTTTCASSCSRARATTSAAAPTSSPATPTRARRKPRTGSIQRRRPDPGAPADPVDAGTSSSRSCARCAVGPRVSASSSRWPPTSRSRPTTRASGSRSGERGFTPDSGATWLLPRRVGEVRARELLLLGRALSGTEAAEWGAIHRAVPDGELDAAVDEVVAHLASGPTIALGLHQVAAQRRRGRDRSTRSSPTRRSRSSCRRAPTTSARASRPFREKRAPRFEGTMNASIVVTPVDVGCRRGTRAGSRRTCRARGSRRAGAAARPPSARCARVPSTKPGIRCSRRPGSSCPRGRSRTAGST